ncbi:MAG: DUF4340 domain-containing protein [Lachnospiraceae bacterium]|nr:DUF4340 domain-containing protein [Lachnospiraceae bacterium]
MTGRKKKNLISLVSLLVVLMLLIVGYALVADRNKKQEEKEAAKEDTSYILSNQEEDAFSNISVTSGDTAFELVYEGDTWYLSGDDEFPLDQTKAGAMADGLESLSSNQLVIESPEDLSEYGLKDPLITVVGTTTYGDTITIAFGDELAAGNGYYSMVNGEAKVYVLTSTIRDKYDMSMTDLLKVEDTPDIDDTLITGVKVSSDTFPSFTLLYDENNATDHSGQNLYPWYISDVYPQNVNADTTAVNDMLTNYTTFSLSSCVDYKKENLGQYGLSTPKTTLSVWYREEEDGEVLEYTVYVGNQDENGNYYVRPENSDCTYIMTASNINKKFDVNPFDFVSKYTHLLNINTVEELNATMNDQKYSYKIDTTMTTDDAGTETTENTFYVNGTLYEEEQTFRNFYQSIIALSVDGVMPEGASYQDNPVLTLEFVRSEEYGGNVTVRYLPYNDSYYAVEVNGIVTYMIDMRKVDDMILSIQEFE